MIHRIATRHKVTHYTPADIERMKRMISMGANKRDIATAMGRSEAAIERQILILRKGAA